MKIAQTPHNAANIPVESEVHSQIFVSEFRNWDAKHAMKKMTFEALCGGETTPIYFKAVSCLFNA